LPRQVRPLFLKSDKLYIEKCVFFPSNDDDSTRWKCLVIPVKFQLILDLKSPLIRHQLMRNWGYYLGNIWRLQRPVHFPLGHSYGVLLLAYYYSAFILHPPFFNQQAPSNCSVC
jgi:hypothetical protein